MVSPFYLSVFAFANLLLIAISYVGFSSLQTYNLEFIKNNLPL